MRTRVLIVLLCLAVAAVAVTRADRQEEVPLRESFSAFPLQLGDWRGVPLAPLSDQVERILGADDYLVRAYFRPDQSGLGLFIGYWRSQKQGDTIHSPLNCLPGAGWQPVSTERLTFADPRATGGPDLTVNRVVIQKGLERQLVLYWYQSHGRIVASEYWGKFYLMADAARLNRTDGSIVRVVVPIAGTDADAEDESERIGLDFIGQLLPALGQFLPS